MDKRDLQLNDLRGGDVPPTLIGNSVLAIAGADPMRALSVLQTRLKPYLGWAKRADFVFEKALVEERGTRQINACGRSCSCSVYRGSAL